MLPATTEGGRGSENNGRANPVAPSHVDATAWAPYTESEFDAWCSRGTNYDIVGRVALVSYCGLSREDT
jgi:hypothetical protein